MWLHRLTSFLLRHRWRALAITFVSTFIPIVGIVSILIAALMTLVKGIKEGTIFTLAATLPYAISFYFAGGYEAAMPIAAWAAVGVAILSNVLTWIFACMLYRHSSWASIIQVASLAGVLAVCLVHVVYPEVAQWWGQHLQEYYTQAQSIAGSISNGAEQAGKAVTKLTTAQVETINETKYFATGLMVAAVLFNAVLQLAVARWWQAVMFQPGSLRQELHNIRLSRLAGSLFVVSLVFWFWDNSVIVDIMPILFLLFCGAGLSLVHYMLGFMRSPTVWIWIVFLYVMLFLAVPYSIIMISLLALLDIWFDIRKRVKKI